MTTIRDMIPSDIPAVVDMITALSVFHDDTAAVTATTLARDTDPTAPWMHVLVAERDDFLVGYMILLPIAKVADGLRGLDINHMYVAASHRGQGIGRSFIDTAKTKARALSCTYMFITTVSDNIEAQAAYTTCGFALQPDSSAKRFRMDVAIQGL